MTSGATTDTRTTLGQNIRAHRERIKLTQRQLAAQVNDVDPNAVSRWERGQSTPGPENLQALAVALGVTVSDLYAEAVAA